MNNPAIELTNSELTTIVSDIGTPASAFLTQDDFTSTTPEGVVVPVEPGDNGASNFSMSLMVLLLGIAVAMFF